MNHTGSCFCGAVEVTVTGSPEAMGYCHCRSCRSWSGGPVNAFSLWKPEAVEITWAGPPPSSNEELDGTVVAVARAGATSGGV